MYKEKKEKKDPYEVLGVHFKASKQEIRAAFIKRSKEVGLILNYKINHLFISVKWRNEILCIIISHVNFL